MKKLIQYKWFRKLFPNKNFYLVDGVWIKPKNFERGGKLEMVEGPYHSLYWCTCGSELSHSGSFTREEYGTGIWEYCCTHCEKHQYANGTLGPFILECDKEGAPLNLG